MAGMGGSSKGPIDQNTFRFGSGGTPGNPIITGGDAAGPWASASTDADRKAAGGSADWGKTTAQATGQNPIQAWWGELQPGQADGSGGIPAGATPSYNPASGKVEWMSLSKNQTPQGGASAGASMQGLMAAGSGAGGGGSDYAAGPMSSDPGAGGDGSGGGPGGAKVVDPSSNNGSSMQGLMSAGGGGDAGGANMLAGPSHFRRGIGTRMLPNEMSPLAGNRKIY